MNADATEPQPMDRTRPAVLARAGFRRGAWVGALSGAVQCLLILHVGVILLAINFWGWSPTSLVQLHSGTPFAWWLGGGLGALTGALAGAVGGWSRSRSLGGAAGAMLGPIVWGSFAGLLFMALQGGAAPPLWHPMISFGAGFGVIPGIIAGVAGAAVKSN